ncbi:hypothetical protein PIB30_046745 [Stylosanthes scabra]|uniref:Uncharacterized protein n=1 Tax=Stylosanthes scabra TaxID=79078 RepID=A0ABU6TG95_9FABA|nr:hypothetical protein [Stylosanthes scabra]
MGPCKCVITFETVELRDKTLGVQFMLEHFIEVRPYQGFKWCLSRRHCENPNGLLSVGAHSTWINVKCGEFEFDVYIKEFGGEVLSSQVHPDEVPKPFDGCSCGCSSENVKATANNLAEVEDTQMVFGGNRVDVGMEVAIEEVSKEKEINANLKIVPCNMRDDDVGVIKK